MPRDDHVRLIHIAEHAELVAQFLRDRQRADLETDKQLLLAVVRALEIVGEAATRMSHEFKTCHPDWPWAQLAGMRNRLVHAYFDINRNIVWNAATVELPALAVQVRAFIEQE